MKKLLEEIQEDILKGKFCERIKMLRKIRGLTIEEMSERCGTTRSGYFNWEKGISTPRRGNKRIIARILEVDQKIIFGEPKMCEFLIKEH